MPSTVIRAFSYDPQTARLAVTFQSERRYVYHEVPPEVAAGFRNAFSKGVFFNRHIRDRYACTRAQEAVG